jgi:predicted nucleic acid-binding Zn ribbon protein
MIKSAIWSQACFSWSLWFQVSGFRFQGSGFRVQRFRVLGSGFKGSGFRVNGIEHSVEES